MPRIDSRCHPPERGRRPLRASSPVPRLTALTRPAFLCAVLAGATLAVLPAAAQSGGDAQPPSRAERYAAAEGSRVLVVTGKAGLLGALGHRHAVLGTEVDAHACLDPARPAAVRAEAKVPTASLVIDSPRARQLAGLKKGPGPDDVEEIQRDMLSGEYLAAEEHPEIAFTLGSVRVGREGPLRLTGTFTLRGVSREVAFPVELERRDDGTRVVRGTFTVRQTDHGIEPASVAGVVNVADPVEVRVHLVLAPTGEPCEPAGS